MLPAVFLLLAFLSSLGPAAAGSPGLVLAARTAPLPLLIVGAGATDPATLYRELSGVVVAGPGPTGHFTWDVGRGQVVDAVGELVATLPADDSGARLARVQRILAKWTLLRALERPGMPLELETRVEPEADVHHQGDHLTVVIGGFRHPFLTLLNLASDGTVNFIYPINDGRLHDSLMVAPGTTYRLPLQVTPPFGAEHFVAIASATALTDLHRALAALDGKPKSAALPDLLDQALAGQDYQIGVQAVFSAR